MYPSLRIIAVIACTWLVAPKAIFAGEAISRAWTVQNAVEPTFTEAISRTNTIQNVVEPVFTEAISRAATVCNTGDLNGDGQIASGDVVGFVDVLIGVDTDWSRKLACDVNCNDSTNGLDIQPFVELLLGG